VAEFGPLTGEKQAAWIEAEFAAIGCKIDRGAATLLAQRAGGDLWNLANEIQKIGHFLGPKIITAADIENNAVATSELNIFATIDAVAQRDKKRALGLIKEHIAKGDHPLYLLAMMASQSKICFGKNLRRRRRFRGALGYPSLCFVKDDGPGPAVYDRGA